jgi:hypothetical protein
MSITLMCSLVGRGVVGKLEEIGGVGVSLGSGRNSSIRVYLIFD